jgi:hypothetical protein
MSFGCPGGLWSGLDSAYSSDCRASSGGVEGADAPGADAPLLAVPSKQFDVCAKVVRAGWLLAGAQARMRAPFAAVLVGLSLD